MDAPRKRPRKPVAFAPLVRSLSKTHPRTAKQLATAQSNRETRLIRLSRGARLAGYEELVAHFIELEDAFRRQKRLAKIAFLIRRVRGEFVCALDAALSGFHSVAHDAMRGVMEAEFLLREFQHSPDAIEEWLTCSEKERHERFRPALLRQRHAKRLGKQPQDVAEAADYRAHSRVLHVSPFANPFGGPGLDGSHLPWADDSCFWEMFEHGRRLLVAAHQLRREIAPRQRNLRGIDDLKKFRDAWERTQEMQAIFLALIEASRSTTERSDPADDEEGS